MQIEVTRRRDAVLIETITVTIPNFANPDEFTDEDLAEMFDNNSISEEWDVDEPYLAVYEVAEA